MRTMVRQPIDHTIKTRNFRARNERIEGVLVKCHVERKVGDCYQWKANAQCSRGDSCCFKHESRLGQRAQSSFSTLRAPTHTDGGKHYIFPSPRVVGPSGLKGKRPCEKFHGGTCTEPSCDFWHPPVCLNYLFESGCKCGDKCKFPHTEAGGQPSKKSKKVGAKGSVAVLERKYSNSLCVPRQSSEKVYSIGLCVP